MKRKLWKHDDRFSFSRDKYKLTIMENTIACDIFLIDIKPTIITSRNKLNETQFLYIKNPFKTKRKNYDT